MEQQGPPCEEFCSRQWDSLRKNTCCEPSVNRRVGTMAPFNFTQRASSRTAIKMQPEDLKMDKLDLSTPTAPSSTALREAQMQAPGSRFGGKMSQAHGTFEPSKAFVRQLAAKSDYRRHLAGLLKEHSLVEGGDLQVATWIKDEGFDTTIPSVMQALENAKANDLLFWASRYNLFVLWSADRTHPWDSLPGAASYVTLEIGKQRGSDSEVVVLLNNSPITEYSFASGVFKTTAPLDWETPTGKTAKVKLELQLSAFFGYGKNDTDSYLGLQAHGVLWVADPTQAPVNWPIAPPIVAGKVNVAGRAAAVAPGSADTLAAFAGVYQTHQLPDCAGKPADAGFELSITMDSAGHPTVSVNGASLHSWSFDAMNVLTWAEEAGVSSAWLQFMALPGGHVFLGSLKTADTPEDAEGFNLFGELCAQPSRLAPDCAMDPAVGQLVASGLASAATLLCASLLRTAFKCWSSLKSGMSADEIHGANELMMERQEAEFATLKRLEGLVTAAEGTFVGAASAKELDPSATADALAAENEAAENAQAAKTAAEATETAAKEAERAADENDALESTSKAAVAAWRASQAQSAAAAAENSALDAAKYARMSHCIRALTAAQAAAQSFNLAKQVAGESAAAEARAAGAALRAVEAGIALYAEKRDYLKLKDIAEASDVAGKALDAAKAAVTGWEAASVASRRGALDAAKVAAEFSQLCHKFMRSVHRA
ncbi:g5133 [Coccomyxa viridis]|uniref:G5133 protein n=1 Tax=Coccomyxa viridis TaxID=1274662 RepID=A0ABP1FX59_9CHLO